MFALPTSISIFRSCVLVSLYILLPLQFALIMMGKIKNWDRLFQERADEGFDKGQQLTEPSYFEFTWFVMSMLQFGVSAIMLIGVHLNKVLLILPWLYLQVVVLFTLAVLITVNMMWVTGILLSDEEGLLEDPQQSKAARNLTLFVILFVIYGVYLVYIKCYVGRFQKAKNLDDIHIESRAAALHEKQAPMDRNATIRRFVRQPYQEMPGPLIAPTMICPLPRPPAPCSAQRPAMPCSMQRLPPPCHVQRPNADGHPVMPTYVIPPAPPPRRFITSSQSLPRYISRSGTACHTIPASASGLTRTLSFPVLTRCGETTTGPGLSTFRADQKQNDSTMETLSFLDDSNVTGSDKSDAWEEETIIGKDLAAKAEKNYTTETSSHWEFSTNNPSSETWV